jgi:Carboxypeptidase regulatory-like domain
VKSDGCGVRRRSPRVSPVARCQVAAHLHWRLITSFIVRLSTLCLAASLFVGASTASAQSTISGSVRRAADSSVIAGATVRVVGVESQVLTKSDGRYTLPLSDGDQRVVASAVGTWPETLSVAAFRGTTHQHDFVLLEAAEVLPAVGVKATRQSRTLQLAGFYDRQSAGIGAFVTPENIQREQGRLIGEIVAKYARVWVHYGGTHAWLSSNRTSSDGGCAFCKKRIQDLLDGADIAAGARPACYMDVYLNGQAIYRGYGQDAHTPPPLFDLNSLAASEIEGIEVYASASQIPARFNASSSGCGVAIIWTKR